MIRFLNANETVQFVGENGVSSSHKLNAVALHDAAAALDIRSVVAVEHEISSVKTTFMKLIAGSSRPDRGRVLTAGIRISPVINEGGRWGR